MRDTVSVFLLDMFSGGKGTGSGHLALTFGTVWSMWNGECKALRTFNPREVSPRISSHGSNFNDCSRFWLPLCNIHAPTASKLSDLNLGACRKSPRQ